jgi:hypothetical protein
MLRWTRRLLRRAHPWPHRYCVGLGIVEGGPCWGAPTVVAGAAKAVVAIILAFPLPLALTLAFDTIVGVWGRRGRGRLK